MQATWAASTSRSRPVLVGIAVLITCLLSIFGVASHPASMTMLTRSNQTQTLADPASSSAAAAANVEEKKVNKDVLLYAYYETEDAKNNFKFFLNHALHDKMDFILIVNGDELTVEIPKRDNIRVIRRPNTCFDLGTFGEVLQADDNALRKRYERFILMNSSIRGPIMPHWSRIMKTCWSDIFLNSLTENNKLAGLSANCDPDYRKHLQSMLLSVDRIGLDLIMPSLQCSETLWDAVLFGETALTMLVREAGYEANPIYSLRSKKNYATSEDFWDHCDNQDVFFPERSDGMDIHPFDTLFVKTDRKSGRQTYTEMGQRNLDTLTKWVEESQYSSYDYC